MDDNRYWRLVKTYCPNGRKEQGERMAKKTTERSYKCRFAGCGKDFGAERAERTKHELEAHNYTHEGGKAARGGRRGGLPLLEQEATANDLIKQAVAKLAGEINTKREQLANVDKLKKEITALENQREQLIKMLPAEPPV